jgi:hypothetical protein
MPYDEEYVKQLERENELLRRKIETSPTLKETLGKYFCLSKEVNRAGEVSYGLKLTPIMIVQKDFEYLETVGILSEEVEVEEDFTNSFIVGNDEDVKKILEEYRKHNIKFPDECIKEINKPCPYKSLEDVENQAKTLLG